MIYKIIYTVCLVLFISTTIQAQDSIEKVLLEIKKNNKSIKANQQNTEAKKLQYKTGLALKNPSIEFEYLIGSPVGSGNQTDFFALQSFDFPTAYRKKKQVSKLQIEESDFQLATIMRIILFEVKKTCIEMVFCHKTRLTLKERLRNTEKLDSDYQTKLSNGSGNVLDANKAKLELINLQNAIRYNTSKIIQLNQKLTELNGGVPISFNDVSYQIPPSLPAFNSLMDSIISNDPTLNVLQKEVEIKQRKMELSKAMALPKIETGYRYQSILGQQYKGVHFGLTIPLWENKNKVKFNAAQTLFSEVKIEEYKNKHYSEVQQLYEKYQSLNSTLLEYKQILATIDNTVLLGKSLRLGEISYIQYFMEISYFNTSYDKYLELEKEYNIVIAELYKYRL